MDWNLTEVIDYITYNAIDNEDFLASDSTAQTRFLNVALRTLQREYKNYVMPNEAVYLFAAVLNANFNDTTVQAQRGIASFSVKGITYTFKDWALKDLSEFISEDVRNLVIEANPDLDGGSGKVKWVTL